MYKWWRQVLASLLYFPSYCPCRQCDGYKSKRCNARSRNRHTMRDDWKRNDWNAHDDCAYMLAECQNEENNV